MTYRSKLCELVDDLNRMANDKLRSPDKRSGEFELSIEDGLMKVSDDRHEDCCRITLRYKEGQMYHLIYSKTGNSSNDFFYHTYFDILRSGILGIDSVGQMKDSFGHDVNLLSFATLLTEGLKKLKTT